MMPFVLLTNHSLARRYQWATRSFNTHFIDRSALQQSNLGLVMNKLAEARAVLATLERREQELIAELNDVHAAVHSQRHKVEELIRQLPVSPISRLPNEVLLRIFELILRGPDAEVRDRCVRWKGQLSEVSQRWRHVILRSPCLWTTIRVCSWRSRALIEAHITRSAKSLLNIIVKPLILPGDKDEWLIRQLELIATCAERWHSLTISSGVSKFQLIQGFNHLSFPSLTSVSIANFPRRLPEELDPPFLRPECVPRIENIYLSGETDMLMGREIPSNVKSLALEFHLPPLGQISSALPLEPMPCQRLTSLSLCLHGCTIFEELPPNSIQFPLLEKFVFKYGVSAALICAIVAPRLKYFEGHWSRFDPSLHDTFAAASDKFSNVDHLELDGESQGDKTVSQSLCLAFPNARHLVLSEVDIVAILRSAEGPNAVFHWQHLESLTINGYLHESKTFVSDLAGCLRRRQEAGLSKLRLNFSRPVSAQKTPFVYEQLNDVCILEGAYSIRNIELSGVIGGKSWLDVLSNQPSILDALRDAVMAGRVRSRGRG